MTWREAFLFQSRSDLRMFDRLAVPSVEACHQVHYFQMATEKLAKALLTTPSAERPPKAVHAALVPMLQVIKKQPEIRRRLGYSSAARFSAYINSLLDVAQRVQNVAPEGAASRPNAEYPWRDPQTGVVHAPAAFHFPEFDRARNPQMVKLDSLVRGLLRCYS